MTNLEAIETAELAEMHYLLGSMLFRINNLAVKWSYVPPVPVQQEPVYYIPQVQIPPSPQPVPDASYQADVQQYESYEAVEPQSDTLVPAVEQAVVPEAEASQPVVEAAVVPQSEPIQSVNVETAAPPAVEAPLPAPAVEPVAATVAPAEVPLPLPTKPVQTEVKPVAPVQAAPPPVAVSAPVPVPPAPPAGPIVPVVPVRPTRPTVSAPVRPAIPRQIPKPGNDYNSRLNKILNP